jgi:hypothetical protein
MVLTLLCDEHIPYPVVKGLRRRGLDVITVQEMGLSSAEDKTIMDRAREEGRVIYTRNGDFLRLHHAGFKHAGIFYHHAMAYSIGEAIRKVMTSCELFAAEEIRNQIKFL